MKVFLVLTSLLALSLSEKIDLEAGEERRIAPERSDELTTTEWELTACKGCKIIASCLILNKNCDKTWMSIYDGQKHHRHCGKDSRFVFKTSVREKMVVTIVNTGYQGAYCKIKTTKPFLNDLHVKRDSSEDGTFEGKKKTSCKCGWTNKGSSRIVGGTEAFTNEYPFPVLISFRRTNYQFCGGSIISPRHVLTAAHCTVPFKGIPLKVIVGEHDTRTESESNHTQYIEVEEVYDHPDYNDKSQLGDISILKLKEPIKFGSHVGPVCLPDIRRELVDDYLKVMGWGHIETGGEASPVLKKVDIKVIDTEICKTVYTGMDSKPSQICTWSPNGDSCQGDSGGPLVWLDPETNMYRQMGIVSFGRECASTDPGVNTDVLQYMAWIRNILSKTAGEAVCV